jgi:hypothetical protein
MKRVLAIALVAGCHPYVSGGVETGSRITGPLATMMAQPVISARQTIADVPAPAMTSVTHTYSAAVGFGVPDFGVEIGLHAHEVTGGTFSLPSSSDSYLSSPRYLASTGSLDFRWTWLRSHHMSTYIHVGPAFAAVVDKGDGSRAYGQGVRYGAGVAVELPVVRLFADASRTDLELMSGPGLGYNQLSGITVGVALH